MSQRKPSCKLDHEGRCRDDHNRIRPVRNCSRPAGGKRTTRLAIHFLARHARAARSCFLSDIQTRRLPHPRRRAVRNALRKDEQTALGNLLRDPNWLPGSGFCRSWCWLGYNRIGNRLRKVREKALGPDHPDVAESLDNLGLLYTGQARYADAEPLYKRSLVITEKALGPTHAEVGTILNNLAALYQFQHRYVEAEPLQKRALAITESALGPDHPDVAASLNNLAALYVKQDRHADAELLLLRSLVIQEKAVGANHPAIATLLNNLAILYEEQGRYADAEPFYRRSLAIQEKAYGLNYPALAKSLNNLASLYWKHRWWRWLIQDELEEVGIILRAPRHRGACFSGVGRLGCMGHSA